MRKIKILFYLLLLTALVNGQVSFTVNIDTSSKAVTLLLAQKKIDAALALVNKLVIENPSDGINYFNRAAINYSKKPKTYDSTVVNDCKRALKMGYRNSELYYLAFLQYFNYYKFEIAKRKIVLVGFFENYSSGYRAQREIIDSAINAKWNEKYFSARFELYNTNEIVTSHFDEYKNEAPTIRSDCEKIIEFTKNKRAKLLAYTYLYQLYLMYYTDTIKAINYLSRAIDFYNINNVKDKTKQEFDSIYDNLYAERGKLKYHIHDFDGAISDYTIHLSKWYDPDIYKERGWAYFTINNSTNALKDLNKAILIYEQERKKLLTSDGQRAKWTLEIHQSDWGIAYLYRGVINKDLKNGKEALRDFNKAIEYGIETAVKEKNELINLAGAISTDPQNTETPSDDNSILMIKKEGVYEIPITINSSLKINFIFDAGASDVSISADVALTLIRTGTVTDKDFVGTQTYKFADGSSAKSKVFILKELQIGSRKVTNVRATISNSLDAPLLLGQSALNRFGKITIDYKKGVIHFED